MAGQHVTAQQMRLFKNLRRNDSPAIADAILDRVIHNAHRIALEGDSMRRKKVARPLTDVENSETNTN